MAFIDIGEIGVCLVGEGTQSGFRIGFSNLIFIVFDRLSVFEEGSVTYQKRPLGLDNCAN
jgi:hypothetical protein